MPISLIVHGGAGLLATDNHNDAKSGCQAAVEAGRAILMASGNAIDAVEAATKILEDNPFFNAGYGSVLNRDGMVEMDALIMSGAGPRIGAVAGVSRVQNPISLARLVMERTEHHLLISAGAEQFGESQGMALVDAQMMIAPHRLAKYLDMKHAQGHDTVGAVALDSAGNVAVAVSTGGLTGKLPGRVGDSPIAGAGAYADNALGAACATGVGEGIIRSLLTFRAVEALKAHNAQSAANNAIRLFGDRYQGDGGLIMIDKDGNVAIAHNSPFMPVAWFSTANGGNPDTIHVQVAVE